MYEHCSLDNYYDIRYVNCPKCFNLDREYISIEGGTNKVYCVTFNCMYCGHEYFKDKE